MSIEAIDAVWRVLVGDSTRKLVLLAVADCARGRDGTGAYESAATYALKAECSERTVQRHITSLLEQGRIREGDQSLAAHIPARHRPIVYDVAMSDGQAAEWSAHREVGRRAASAAYGSKGGVAAAPVLKAKREAIARGDNLSPHPEPDSTRGDSRGVILSPLTGDNLSPHMTPLNGHENGQSTPVRGDTWGDTRGDVGVTQASEPTSYGSNQGQNLIAQPALDVEVPAPEGADAPKSRKRKMPSDPPGFFEFWTIYPRGEDRPGAAAEFAKALKKVPAERIIEAAIRFRDDVNREEQFTPYGTKWLKQERWNAGPCPVRNQPGGRRHQSDGYQNGIELAEREFHRERAMATHRQELEAGATP